jgi:hypothetical protein
VYCDQLIRTLIKNSASGPFYERFESFELFPPVVSMGLLRGYLIIVKIEDRFETRNLKIDQIDLAENSCGSVSAYGD